MRKLATLAIALVLLPIMVPVVGSEEGPEPNYPRSISTEGASGVFFDEFEDEGNVTLSGDMVARDGRLTLDPKVLMEDDFNRTVLSPWTPTSGTPTVEDDRLHLNSTSGVNDSVIRSIDHYDVKLQVWMNFTTFGTGGPYVKFVFEAMSLRYLIDYADEAMLLQVMGPDGTVNVSDRSGLGIREGLSFAFRASIKGDVPHVHLQQEWRPGYSPNWRLYCDLVNRTGNVTGIELGCWGGADGYLDDLDVVDQGAEGIALSPVIELPEGCIWDRGTAPGGYDTFTNVGVVDILDAGTAMPIPGYHLTGWWQWSTDLQGVDIHRHPSIILRARFWLEDTSVPFMYNWSVSWRPGGPLWMDSFEDLANCTLDGVAHNNERGYLYLDGRIWSDTFDTEDGSPWTAFGTENGASVGVSEGALLITGPSSGSESAGVTWEFDLVQFGFYFDFYVERVGPGGFEINLSTDSGKAFVLSWKEDTILEWYSWDGHNLRVFVDYDRYWPGHWYDDGEIEISIDGDLDFGGDGGYTGTRYYFGENFTSATVSCGEGSQLRLDNVALERSIIEGDVFSETIVLPDGMLWDRLRVGYGEDDDREWSLVSLDVLDGSTLEAVPGYAGLTEKDMIPRDNAPELDLTGIDPARHPTIVMRAHLTFFEVQWSSLSWWQVWWRPGSNVLMDPFDDGHLVNVHGDVDVDNGRIMTGNLLVADEFDRLDMAPWSTETGSAAISWGHLWVLGDTSETTVVRDLAPADELRVEVSHRTYYHPDVTKAPSIELRCEDGQVLRFKTATNLGGLEIEYFNGQTSRRVAVGAISFQFVDYEWYRIQVEYDGTRALFKFGDAEIEGIVTIDSPFDRVALIGGIAGRIWWDDFRASLPSESGSAVTDLFTVPTGEGWVWLEVRSNATGNATLRMSLEDADTGEVVEGFEYMEGFLFELSAISSVDPLDVRLRFEMTGSYHEVPFLDYYRVYWTGMQDTLEQVEDIDTIMIQEDEPMEDVLDLRDYFSSTLTPSEMLVYEVIDSSDPRHVNVTVEGWMLSIDLPVEDWYGNATFRIFCSNGFMEVITDPVKVVVQPRDDWPSFNPPENVTVVEDVPYTLDLAPFIHDVDTPLSEMSITTTNANCSVDGLNLTMLFHDGDIDTRVGVRLHSPGGSQGGSIKVRVEENPNKPDVDDPPTVATISAIEFDEDTEFVLDLGPYIQDPDTDYEDLVLSVDEPNCTIEGLVLTFYFEDVEVTLDLRLILEVSDGNNTVNRTLRLRVWDVPDVPPPPPDVWPPEVDAIPMQAFQVGAERVVDLSPFITDRDTLPGDLTLSSEQSEVLAVDGLELTVRFTGVPGGTYSIRFTASDGVHEVEGSFGVVVKDADKYPQAEWYTTDAGLLSIVIIVIAVLAVTALVVRRRERSG